MPAALALIALVSTVGAPDTEQSTSRQWLLEPELKLRFSSGAEWDTNARRVVDDRTEDPVSDGLVRMLLNTTLNLSVTSKDSLRLSYLLGAKRFMEQTSEDIVVHDLSASTQHVLTSWLAGSLYGSWRLNRIRSGIRDYTLATVGGNLAAFAKKGFRFRARTAFSRLSFPPLAKLSHRGPLVGAEVGYRPSRRFDISVNVDHAWRFFDGNAIVRAEFPDIEEVVFTFCDGDDGVSQERCTSERRRDTIFSVNARAAYRGSFILGGEFGVRNQRSNSEFEDFNRFRFSAFATVPLPLDFVLNVIGAVQFISQISLTSTNFRFQPEDDENQNSIKVQLTRRIVGGLSGNLMYQLFANQFATADANFLRQTVFLGVSFDLEDDDS